ncbi:MAG: hypothetical protein MJ132_08165, partial [Clostridia bacterium]|nr:hypothetical protein [Clostridia bacterium]
MQKAKRLLAMISAIIITAVFCVMPVSATVPVPTGETYELYDTVGYDDLYIGTTSMAGRTMNGGRNYTYNATAPTYSAVFSFRWIPRGSENDLKFTVFFDDWVYPFCFAAKAPNQSGFGKTAGPNGAWHIVPSDGSLCVDMNTPIVLGQPYDMEMGRLKVKTGANAGKYYVYWKVNGELVQSYYYAGVSGGVYGNGTALSNKIIFSASDANYFTAIPFTEAYDDYDEIGLDDLYVGEDSLAGRTLAGGDYTCTYRATSPSFSSVLKFRWIPGGALTRFSMYFDAFAYPFCFAVKSPNQTGFGAVPGPNGAWHLVPSNGNLMVNMSEPIVAGNPYDMEMGRLKVMNGFNVGKYYVYWKVNGTLIQSYYYDGVADGTYGSGTALSNKIIIQLPNGNKFTAISSVETYAAYDEIEYEDLYRDGVRVGKQTQMAGATVFTYNRTSPTGSAVFRFRLRVGSVAKLQMSFEKTNASTMAYVFGAWLEPDGQYPNGRMWLRPGYGPQTNLPALLEPYSTHNVEFARLRVNSGANNGKYLVYIKIDGVTVATDYVDAAVVD